MIMNRACGNACLSSLIATVQADERGATIYCSEKLEKSAESRERTGK